MDNLANNLKIALASNFSLYLKTHFFHWNVEGPYFPQLHSMFETQYNDLWEAVDKFAEEIRTIGSYAPGSLARYKQLTQVSDQTKIPNAKQMLDELASDHVKMVDILNNTFQAAQEVNNQAIMNFIADRLDKHNKFHWMLTATAKNLV